MGALCALSAHKWFFVGPGLVIVGTLFFSLKPTKLPIQRHQKQQNRLRIQAYRRKKERKNQFFLENARDSACRPNLASRRAAGNSRTNFKLQEIKLDKCI